MAVSLINDVLIRVLKRQKTPYVPIWLMRQAGRYLSEYNATRARAGSFLQLAKTPELATEVTLQPLARFPLDAAILFSDILTIPDAMGLGLSFQAGEGPQFAHPLQDEKAVAKLAVPEMDVHLDYVFAAVKEIRRALCNAQQQQSVPLIGFSGSPWTLACYMIEGRGSKEFMLAKKMLYQRPDLIHQILKVNTDSVILYLKKQIEAGAQVVMLFDTWGGLLSDRAYSTFSLHYLQQIVNALRQDPLTQSVPIISYTKGGGLWIEAQADSGVDALGLDWTVNLNHARQQVGHKVCLQGNIDPMILLSSPSVIRHAARQVIDDFGAHPGYIFNLGHGISQFTPPEHVAELVDEVHNYSRGKLQQMM